MERLWGKIKDFYAENPKLVKDLVRLAQYREVNWKGKRLKRSRKSHPATTNSRKRKGRTATTKRKNPPSKSTPLITQHRQTRHEAQPSPGKSSGEEVGNIQEGCG